MTKIEMTRETLVSNLQAELNRLNQELTWINNECEWIVTTKGNIRAVKGQARRYYRELVIYRDQVTEYAAVISQDIVTARSWSIDTFRYYLHNDCTIQSWLGWN